MRITSNDVQTLMLLVKRFMLAIMMGVRYVAVGNAAALNEITLGSDQVEKKPMLSKRRVKQFSPVVINQDIYDIPAMVRLRKVKLDEWQDENLKPIALDKMLKEHYEQLTAKGLKPSNLYLDV